jgi:hypothetical protein
MPCIVISCALAPPLESAATITAASIFQTRDDMPPPPDPAASKRNRRSKEREDAKAIRRSTSAGSNQSATPRNLSQWKLQCACPATYRRSGPVQSLGNSLSAARTEDELSELFIPLGRPRPVVASFSFPLRLEPELDQAADGVRTCSLVVLGPLINRAYSVRRDARRYHRVAPRRRTAPFLFLVYLY